jgi:UDP-glucose 4-epimerase
VRDYIYMGDVVDGLLAALERTTDGRIFNIGSRHGHSLNQLLDSIENVTGCTANRRYLPGQQFDILGAAGARELLDWSPKVSFESALKNLPIG